MWALLTLIQLYYGLKLEMLTLSTFFTTLSVRPPFNNVICCTRRLDQEWLVNCKVIFKEKSKLFASKFFTVLNGTTTILVFSLVIS
jgi:hypothetical protein